MSGRKPVAVVAALAAVVLPSCTRVVSDARAVAGERPSAAALSDDNECTPVDAPLAVIPTDAGDPVMKIPQPPGWVRFTKMDSEILRYMLQNEDLTASAVVTGESIDGAADPEALFDGVQEGIIEMTGAPPTEVARHRHCGLPAESASFVNPGFGPTGPMPTKALTVVMERDGRTHGVTVQVASNAPDDPTYASYAETILTGFQMLPPPPS